MPCVVVSDKNQLVRHNNNSIENIASIPLRESWLHLFGKKSNMLKDFNVGCVLSFLREPVWLSGILEML